MASALTIDPHGRCRRSVAPTKLSPHTEDIIVIDRWRACEVRLAPQHVTWHAYCALIDHLDGHQHSIVLQWWDGVERTEILPNLDALQRRLLDLMTGPRDASRFLYRPRTIDDLAEDHPLAGLVSLWRASGGGPIDLAQNRDAIDALTNAKYMVVKPDRDASTMRFTQFGASPWYVYLDKHWTSKCISHRVEDQPDYDYGKWVARALHAAVKAGVPTITDADALVLSDGIERRMQYTRVTLPIIGAGDEPELLSTSLRDARVDLRQSIH